MTVLTPVWMQAGTYSAEQDRQVISALMYPSPSNNMQARSGVFAGTGLGSMQAIPTGTASMAVVVQSGIAAVSGTYTRGQGTYLVTNDDNVTLTVTTANSTNPRIDLVVLEVLDSVYAGTVDAAQFRVVAGTPATSPAVPALPQSAIPIAQIYVSPNANSIAAGSITDRRQYTGSRGEVVTCTAATRPANPSDHMRIYESDTRYYRRWDGTGWVYTGTNADPDSSASNASHHPTVTAQALDMQWNSNGADVVSPWVWVRNDPGIVTYDQGTRHFRIVERGIYTINIRVASDCAYPGRVDVNLALPGGVQVSPTGNLYTLLQRATGYAGAGLITSDNSITQYAEAGWEFWVSLFQFNTGGINVGMSTYITITRLPG